MYVKKFEADTLDEALKAVKHELGPDAIILKTVTNKGLKGAFKNKKIEITAAISQKDYTKKASVDKVLTEDQRKQFYDGSAKQASQTIDVYAGKRVERKEISIPKEPGYGKLALNKMVATVTTTNSDFADIGKKAKDKIKSSLDDFLGADEHEQFEEDTTSSYKEEVTPIYKSSSREEVSSSNQNNVLFAQQKELIDELKMELKSQQNKMFVLEKKLQEISTVSNDESPDLKALIRIKNQLKMLDLEEKIVQELIRKCQLELSKEEIKSEEILNDFVLHQMTQMINVDRPLFLTENKKKVVTVFVSEAASGQTSLCLKVAVLKKDVVIIEYSPGNDEISGHQFTSKLFNISRIRVHTPAEIVGEMRKALEQGLSVCLDLHLNLKTGDETKRFIDTITKSFDSVEVLLTLSAIHSEAYNRKIIARYKELLDGIIISHMDLCVSFGAIFNTHQAHRELPLKLYGTGPIVPDDLEEASSERIVAGMFKFSDN